MIHVERKEVCCGCQACALACPRKCVTMLPDAEGFVYPSVDQAACSGCGLCERVCPILTKTEARKDHEPKAYAAYSHREDLRLASSSGGVFSLIAEQVLSRQGVVYGAAMAGVDAVKHMRVSSPEELKLLRGSKYVQSDIGRTYAQAREDLSAGTVVLFTGTPCQIGGLRAFLQKDYDNLICMDIICHGVPSPMVWEKYVRYRQTRANSPAQRVSFRSKKYGWKEFSVEVEFANGSVYRNSLGDDLFMQAFLHDLCLRPSCYQCAFKKINRVSDITVADFWGVNKVCPEMDDDKGTSLVLVHSEKGSRIFCQISENMKWREVDLVSGIQDNPSMLTPVKRPDARESFLREIQEEPFPRVVRRYVKRRRTVKSAAKSVLRRLGLWNP